MAHANAHLTEVGWLLVCPYTGRGGRDFTGAARACPTDVLGRLRPS